MSNDPNPVVIRSQEDWQRFRDKFEGDERAWAELRKAEQARLDRDAAIDDLLSSRQSRARGGRPQEVTLPMVRAAMVELVSGRPRRKPTQEALQGLRGWDRKTIRARAREFPGGWRALRSAVEASGE